MTHCRLITGWRETDKCTLATSDNESIMFPIKHWVMEFMVEAVATFVLHKVRIYIPGLFMTFLENQWKVMDWFKEMCQFLLKRTLIYVIHRLISVLHSMIDRKFLINMLYCFGHKTFSKPNDLTTHLPV